jgi:hypothetical protein
MQSQLGSVQTSSPLTSNLPNLIKDNQVSRVTEGIENQNRPITEEES